MKIKFELNKIKCLTLIITLMVTLFVPFSYPSSTTQLLTQERRGSLSGCDGIVETVKLDWNDIRTILAAVDNSEDFDGFGQKSTFETEQALDALGKSYDEGVTGAKNQFILSADEKPVYLFDMLKHSAANPDSACHMTSLVSDSYMSYITNVDQSITFCSEYGSYECESGKADSYSLEYTTEITKQIAELQKLLAKDTSLDQEESKWTQIQEKVTEYSDPSSWKENVKSDIYEGDYGTLFTVGETNDINRFINARDYDGAEKLTYQIIKGRINELQQKISTSTVNFVESNKTQLGLTNADQALMFPDNLARYIKSLKDLWQEEDWLVLANIATTVVGVVNVVSGIKAANVAKKGALSLRADPSDEKSLAKVKGVAQGILKNAKKTASADEIAEIDIILKSINDAKDAASYNKVLDTVVTKGNPLFSILKPNNVPDLKPLRDGLIDTLTDDDAITALKNSGIDENEIEFIVDELKQASITDPADWNKAISPYEDILNGYKKTLGNDFFDEDGATTIVKYAQAQALGRHYSKIATKYPKAMTWIKYFKSIDNTISVGRILNNVVFSAYILMKQPVAFYEVSAPIYTLTPQTKVIGNNPSYLKIIKTSKYLKWFEYDLYPENFFENLCQLEWLNIREIVGTEHYEPIEKKMKNIGDIISLVDQESKAEILVGQAKTTNMIYEAVGMMNEKVWHFQNINDDKTQYYGFENPNAYYSKGSEYKYTTMAFEAKNVDISGLTIGVEKDWAKYQASEIGKFVPSAGTFLTTALLGGMAVPIAGIGTTIGARIGTTATQIFSAFVLSRLLNAYGITKIGSEIHGNAWMGKIIDLEEAYSSGNHCSAVREESFAKVRKWLTAKEIVTGVSFALEITELALTSTVAGSPVAAVLFAAGGITVGAADYWTTKEYDDAKEEGLYNMKRCYETEYHILSWSSIEQPEKTEENLEQDLIKQGNDLFNNAISSIVSTISPEAKETITEIAQDYQWNTLHVSGLIDGKSMINLYGNKVYQVHFDGDSAIKWFSKEECNIDLCKQDDEGNYKCLSKQGYFLFDENGNMVFNGPQMAFFEWNNMDLYAGIPQTVINIQQAKDELLRVSPTDVKMTNNCVLDEVSQLTKRTYSNNNVKVSFGDLDIINTGDETVWMDGDSVAVHFQKEKNLNGVVYRASETARFEDAEIVIYRNGEIGVESSSGQDLLGGTLMVQENAGAIVFSNAMLIPGRSDRITRNSEERIITSNYNKLGTDKVLHLAIRDLLDVSGKDLTDLEIADFCEENGYTQGIKLSGKLKTSSQDSEEMQKLLDEICFSELQGENDEIITIKDNQFCYTDAYGDKKCCEILDISGGKIKTSCGDSEIYQDPITGQPIIIMPDGTRIPLISMQGLGGFLGFNPESGKITISDLLKFSINPAFNQYGALSTPGMATPTLPDWVTPRDVSGGEDNYPYKEDNIIARLPAMPENPFWYAIFIITIMSMILAIRIKHNKEE